MPCTTCGNLTFRYAFIEMSPGKSPEEEGWITRKDVDSRVLNAQFGSFYDRPRSSPEKEKIIKICLKASIRYIADNCKFPNWLGYLGLLLYEVEEARSYGSLSLNWTKQLKEYVFREDNEEDSELGNLFDEIINEGRLLKWGDLERIEEHIIASHTSN